MVIASTTPRTVAQRLTELLQNFPAAAAGGVQWSTLVRKYEERHSVRLDLAALGYDSPLAATTALLWEVLRLVDSEDMDNPVVAVEDSVVLAPKPGCVASWPSLYKVLCKVVQEHGSIQEDNGDRGILVSQLKQLLQRHWHSTFDESSFSYFTEEGSIVKIKKMKHLLTALLRWRMQRMDWTGEARGRRSSEVDKAMEQELQLVPSKRHNDLILRIEQPYFSALKSEVDASVPCRTLWSDTMDIEADTASSSPESTAPSSASAAVQDEIAALRAENDALRRKNNALAFHGMEHFQQSWAHGALLAKQQLQLPPMDLPEDLLDNPFEPPPQVCSSFWGSVSPSCSTGARSSCFSDSTEGTPLAASSCSQSGTATPVPFGVGQAVALMPVGWFAMGDRVEIPSGLVQNACAMFERHTTIPNWFAQQ